MDVFVKVAQFVLSLSLLIVLHELGHFLPARYFKTRVEKFYLFFDPWFSLFKKKIGETEYGIGWLPLGGYVKISGMIDESMDTDQMKEPAKPWEFRSKPAWQRLIIMVGGVTVNVILAFFIYAMILYTWGKMYLPNENLIYGVYVSSVMEAQGLKHGDKLITIDGKAPLTLAEAYQMILIEGGRNIELERDGKQMTIALSADVDQEMLKRSEQRGFEERFPAVVDTVLQGTEAEKIGLMKADRFIAVNQTEASYLPEMLYAIRAMAGNEVQLSILRGRDTLMLSAQISEEGRLGFGYRPASEFLQLERKSYGFFESFPAGVREGTSIVVSYVRSLKLLFSSEGVKQVGGFITITNLFDTKWNWYRFWNMTALLSIILAVMNILPIPALDGGHVMFLLVEMITGRQPNQKFLEYAQMVGLILLFALLLYANGMDVVRHYFK